MSYGHQTSVEFMNILHNAVFSYLVNICNCARNAKGCKYTFQSLLLRALVLLCSMHEFYINYA